MIGSVSKHRVLPRPSQDPRWDSRDDNPHLIPTQDRTTEILWACRDILDLISAFILCSSFSFSPRISFPRVLYHATRNYL